VALLLLSPQIPMVFMGEEWGSRAPFLFFTDHEPGLAQLVREGRRREFAAFADMAHGREIPDPNSPSSFMDSDPARDAPRRAQWLSLYRHLLSLRKQFVIPGLAQAQTLGAWAAGDKAVVVRWRMGSQTLTLASNLGHQAVTTDLPEDTPFHGKASGKTLPAVTTLAWLTA